MIRKDEGVSLCDNTLQAAVNWVTHPLMSLQSTNSTEGDGEGLG